MNLSKWLIVFVASTSLLLGSLLYVKSHPTVPSPESMIGVGGSSPLVQTPQEATLDDAINSITVPELERNLKYLAADELEGRMSGKKGNIASAEYVKKAYESYGLPTMYHKFSIRRANPGPKNETGDDFTQNVYAWIEGNDPALKDEIVVVGAHLDHIGYGPSMSATPNRREIHNGADDNASGSVALMSIAKAFASMKGKVKRTVVFQSYSAEEMGLIGSNYYCNNPVFPKSRPSIQRHIFMLNMDMVGRLGEGKYFASFYDGESSIDINRYIDELNGKYSFAKRITSRGTSGSDHASFYNKKVPIAFLHTGMHKQWHTPDDDVDKINYDGLGKVARYAFELAWKVAQSDARPKFNDKDFRPMPTTHDHGHPEMPFHLHHPLRDE